MKNSADIFYFFIHFVIPFCSKKIKIRSETIKFCIYLNEKKSRANQTVYLNKNK